jgi:hypothetical protein
MKWLKLFENFQNFPDVFGEKLMRGVRVDREEYIDDPKLRNVSTGHSNDREYVDFLNNFKKLGLQDPTKSVHFFLNPSEESTNWFGEKYRVIPHKDAKFSFNIETRNGGLGSTYFFIDRTLEDFTDLNDKDFNYDWMLYGSELNTDQLKDYQNFLIKNRVVGNLTYDELLELSKSDGKPMQIWTESEVLHKRFIEKKREREPRPYKNKPLLYREDFENLGIKSSDIHLFYKSDIGKTIKKFQDKVIDFPSRFNLFREESLELLKKWKNDVLGEL